jgi:hypothetical protein
MDAWACQFKGNYARIDREYRRATDGEKLNLNSLGQVNRDEKVRYAKAA